MDREEVTKEVQEDIKKERKKEGGRTEMKK